MNSLRKNVIKTIADKCAEMQVTVSKDLVSFLLTLSELNTACRLDESDESAMELAVRRVTEKLLAQSSPSLVTLKIQLYFAKHYASRDDTVKKHRLRLHKKTGPLVTEICKTESLEDDIGIERLYQKILVVITLLSGLGNPMVAPVLKEVAVALQSVYQPTELSNYVTLTKHEKEEQLMQLMCIVAGIRLFNRDCQRGGEGIDDLPGILQEAVGKSRDAVFEMLGELMKTVYRLTGAVERIIEDNADESEDENNRSVEGARDEDFVWAVELLTACRQQEIYIRKLLADLEECEKELKLLMERLQGRLLKLHDTVRYRTAIPTLQVYPQFIDLADIWMRLQDEVIVLSNINSFLWQLRVLCTKNVNVHDHTRLDGILRDCEVLTDAERLEQSMGRLITDCGDCLIYYPNNTKDLEQINLEFGRGGSEIWPGAKQVGFVHEALDFVRRHHEYVHLFQLYDDIEAMKNREEYPHHRSFRETDEGCLLSKVQRDQGVQTDFHTLPSHIDENYSHSVWEHRRRALRLATIAQCSTRSTQTAKSHFRSGAYVQAALPKERAVQTRRDGEANTIRLKTFIFGLRGRRDEKQHVLTFADDRSALL